MRHKVVFVKRKNEKNTKKSGIPVKKRVPDTSFSSEPHKKTQNVPENIFFDLNITGTDFILSK